MAQCLRTLLLFQRAGVWFPAYMPGGSQLPVTLAPDDPMPSVLHRHLYPSDTYTKIKIILLLRDTCKCAVSSSIPIVSWTQTHLHAFILKAPLSQLLQGSRLTMKREKHEVLTLGMRPVGCQRPSSKTSALIQQLNENSYSILQFKMLFWNCFKSLR